MLAWRVGARWYALAVLSAPFLMLALLLALSLVSPAFVPGIFVTDDKASLLSFGITVALAAGILEELGWTGFAVPRLRLSYGMLATGLIVGLLWAAWHMLAAFWASGSSSVALLDPLLFLAVFRVLMVWVYERTGSLLVAMLMHMSLTASALILGPAAAAGVSLLAFDLVWAAAVSIVVAALFNYAVAHARITTHPH